MNTSELQLKRLMDNVVKILPVIEADGIKIPQKTLWHYTEKVDHE